MVEFEITKHIAVLSESNGWAKELNLVSWNGRMPVYDLRSWTDGHSKMSKGITLTEKEFSELKKVIAEQF